MPRLWGQNGLDGSDHLHLHTKGSDEGDSSQFCFPKMGVEKLRTWLLVQVMFQVVVSQTFFRFDPPGGNDPQISQVGGSTATWQATDQGATATIPANLYTMAQLPCLVGDVTMTWMIFQFPWWIGELVVILGYLNSKSKKVKNKYQALCLINNIASMKWASPFNQGIFLPAEMAPPSLRWWQNFKLRCSHEVR